MKKKIILSFGMLFLTFLTASAQTISPKAIYTDSTGVVNEVTSIDNGQAPLEVSFRANPSGLGAHTASYEWHFRRDPGNNKLEEMFVRYEEDTQYTFTESGTYSILLKATLDDESEIDPDSIKIVISDSWLEFPNAFTPNGDGLNDTYHAKPGYRSIVSFQATIINRWGQKLFTWNDPAKGWDGTYHGSKCKEGVYFVIVKARGADGREYNIRKDVNLLRHYSEGGSTSGK